MNPVFWTPERCEELRTRDPVAFRTDVLGEFADPEMSLFSTDDLRAVTRSGSLELPPDPKHHYIAAIDPATRADAWTLVVATRNAAGVSQIAMARQWHARQGLPLSPQAVLREIAEILRPYNVARVVTDQWAADALADLGAQVGLWLHSISITSAKKVELFESMRALILANRVELPPMQELIDDLRRVRKRVTQSGISIELPRAAGRHCDFAFAAALALSQPLGDPDTDAPKRVDGWEDWELDEADKLARRMRRRGDDDAEADQVSELDPWD